MTNGLTLLIFAVSDPTHDFPSNGTPFHSTEKGFTPLFPASSLHHRFPKKFRWFQKTPYSALTPSFLSLRPSSLNSPTHCPSTEPIFIKNAHHSTPLLALPKYPYKNLTLTRKEWNWLSIVVVWSKSCPKADRVQWSGQVWSSSFQNPVRVRCAH